MASLYPTDLAGQVPAAKRRNQEMMLQGIAGLGQGFGDTLGGIGQLVEQQRKKKILDQIVQAMRTQGAPQQGPQLPGVGMAGGSQTPASGMGAPAQDNSNILQSLLMKYDPQAMIQRMPTPLQQSEIARNQAQARRYNQMGGGPPNQPTASQQLRQNFIDAMNKRTDVYGKRVQYGQIDRLARSTGIQPGLLKQIQTNNVRADRALAVLSQGTIYPVKKNLALIDLAGIMQGGAPQLVELHNTQFPTWQDTAAKLQTWATGNPNVPLPPQLVQEIKALVQGVKEVDNEYLRQNADFQKGMLGPTIEGFQKNVAPVVNRATERFIQGGVGRSQSGGGTVSNFMVTP